MVEIHLITLFYRMLISFMFICRNTFLITIRRLSLHLGLELFSSRLFLA